MLVVFWIVISFIIGWAATTKDRSFIGWTFISLLISPIIAGIVLAIIPKSKPMDYKESVKGGYNI